MITQCQSLKVASECGAKPALDLQETVLEIRDRILSFVIARLRFLL